MRNVFPAILDLFPANLEGNSLFPSKLAGNRIYFLLNLEGNRLFPLIFISHYFLFSLFVSDYLYLNNILYLMYPCGIQHLKNHQDSTQEPPASF